MAKKIAIPTREGMVDDHFGHCAYYTVITLDEQNEYENSHCHRFDERLSEFC